MGKAFWIIVVIAAFFGIHEGSNYLRDRSSILSLVENTEFVKAKAGDPVDTEFKRSLHLPKCGKDCPHGVNRYVLLYKGDKGVYSFAVDYHRNERGIKNVGVCDEQGKMVSHDVGAPKDCN